MQNSDKRVHTPFPRDKNLTVNLITERTQSNLNEYNVTTHTFPAIIKTTPKSFKHNYFPHK